MIWWSIPAVTSAVFVLWLADWVPLKALAVAIGMAAPMLVIRLVARLRR